MFGRAVSVPLFWVIEEGVAPRYHEILSRHNMVFHRPLVVTGGSATAQLAEETFTGLPTVAVGSNSIKEVERVKSEARQIGADLLIGFGGGKVIDTAKMAATELNLPFLSMPTATSNDALASPVAVIDFGEYVKSMGATAPLGVIADLSLLRSQPKAQFLAGVGDLFSNLSALMDWKLASEKGYERLDPVAAYLSRNAVENLLRAIESGEDLHPVVVEGLIVSGVAMILAGNSRPCSGAEHLISHALDLMESHSLHGLQVGLASFFTLRLHGCEYQTYQRLLSGVGFPSCWQALGITDSQFMEAVKYAPKTRSGRYTVLSEIDPVVLEEAYYEVYGVGSCGDGERL